MFNTQEFRDMLAEKLKSAVSARSLYGFDESIIDELQKIAIDVSSRVGPDPDIEASADIEPVQSRSADTIAQTAAAIAQGAGRVYITWAEVEAAIELKFCSVYPFCKPQQYYAP